MTSKAFLPMGIMTYRDKIFMNIETRTGVGTCFCLNRSNDIVMVKI